MKKNHCRIAEKVIDEVSENPQDKTLIINYIGISLVIGTIIFASTFGFVAGKTFISYMGSKIIDNTK
jgi:hypothetical protein